MTCIPTAVEEGVPDVFGIWSLVFISVLNPGRNMRMLILKEKKLTFI